jgi:hypothetical protein
MARSSVADRFRNRCTFNFEWFIEKWSSHFTRGPPVVRLSILDPLVSFQRAYVCLASTIEALSDASFSDCNRLRHAVFEYGGQISTFGESSFSQCTSLR